MSVDKPIISIGGARYFDPEKYINTKTYPIIGKKDHYHHENAMLFHEEANKHQKDSVNTVVCDGSHMIPENVVGKAIDDLNKDAKATNEKRCLPCYKS